MLTRRQLDMLLYLTNHSGAVTGATLAELFNVTVRTLRTDIKKLNAFLHDYDCSIQSSNQYGYRINEADMVKIHQLQVFHIIKSDSYFDIPQTPNERISFLFFLLSGKESFQIEDLAERLFISTASIYHDLQIIRRFVDKRFEGLTLHHKDGKYQLQGAEVAKRNLVSGIVSQRYDHFLEKKYSDYISPNGEFLKVLYQVIELITLHQEEFHFELSGEGLYSFATDVAVSMQREKTGLAITYDVEELIGSFQALMQFLCRNIPVLRCLDQRNWSYLQQRFLSKTFMDSPFTEDNFLDYSVIQDYQHDIKKEYGIAVLQDDKSRQYALSFLEFLHHNKSQHFYWNAEDKYEVMNEYQLSYLLAICFSIILYQKTKYHLNPSYLAKFSLVLEESFLRNEIKCRAILVSNKDKDHVLCLLHKLVRYFGNKLDIMKCVTSYDVSYHKESLDDYDLIISTELIDGLDLDSYVRISSIATFDDLQKLSDYFEEMETKVHQSLTRCVVHQTWDSSNVKEQLIQFMKQNEEITIRKEQLLHDWDLEDTFYMQRKNDRLYLCTPLATSQHNIMFQLFGEQGCNYKKREYRSIQLLVVQPEHMKQIAAIMSMCF